MQSNGGTEEAGTRVLEEWSSKTEDLSGGSTLEGKEQSGTGQGAPRPW